MSCEVLYVFPVLAVGVCCGPHSFHRFTIMLSQIDWQTRHYIRSVTARVCNFSRALACNDNWSGYVKRSRIATCKLQFPDADQIKVKHGSVIDSDVMINRESRQVERS